jgi:hypothetical protein
MELLLALLAIVGFPLTIYQVWQGVKAAKGAERAAKLAQTASERAEAAAKNVRGSLVLATTIGDCVVALGMMEQIKVHHREGNWKALPNLCSEVKHRLISIRSHNDNLTDGHREALQLTIGQFTTLQGTAERQMAGGAKAASVPRLNEIVSEQADRLQTILTELQRSIREQDHGRK